MSHTLHVRPHRVARVLLGTVALLVLLATLPARSPARFIGAGALYVGGALGIELVEAALLDSVARTTLLGIAVTHAREALEMTGVVLFAHALLDYLRAHVGTVQLCFAEAPSPAAPAGAPTSPSERVYELSV